MIVMVLTREQERKKLLMVIKKHERLVKRQMIKAGRGRGERINLTDLMISKENVEEKIRKFKEEDDK